MGILLKLRRGVKIPIALLNIVKKRLKEYLCFSICYKIYRDWHNDCFR